MRGIALLLALSLCAVAVVLPGEASAHINVCVTADGCCNAGHVGTPEPHGCIVLIPDGGLP